MLMSIALAAAMSSQGAGPRVATPDFNLVKVKKDEGVAWRAHLATKLMERGVDVVPINTLPVKKKKLLACAHRKASCAIDLAKAMAVDAVVVGEVAKSGKGFQVKVRVLAAANAKPLFVYAKLVRAEADVVDALNTAAERAALKLGVEATPPGDEPTPVAAAEPKPEKQPKTEPEPKAEATPPTTVAAAPVTPPEPEVEDVLAPTPTIKRTRRSRGVKWQPWAVGGAGLIIAGVGTYFLVSAGGTWGNLTGEPTQAYLPSAALTDANAAAGNRTIGMVVTGVGAAVAAAGIAWIFLEDDLRLLSFAPTADGFAFSFSGRW